MFIHFYEQVRYLILDKKWIKIMYTMQFLRIILDMMGVIYIISTIQKFFSNEHRFACFKILLTLGKQDYDP